MVQVWFHKTEYILSAIGAPLIDPALPPTEFGNFCPFQFPWRDAAQAMADFEASMVRGLYPDIFKRLNYAWAGLYSVNVIAFGVVGTVDEVRHRRSQAESLQFSMGHLLASAVSKCGRCGVTMAGGCWSEQLVKAARSDWEPYLERYTRWQNRCDAARTAAADVQRYSKAELVQSKK